MKKQSHTRDKTTDIRDKNTDTIDRHSGETERGGKTELCLFADSIHESCNLRHQVTPRGEIVLTRVASLRIGATNKQSVARWNGPPRSRAGNVRPAYFCLIPNTLIYIKIMIYRDGKTWFSQQISHTF